MAKYRMRFETRVRRINGYDPTWRPSGGQKRRLPIVDWVACPYCGDQFNPILGFDGPADSQGRVRYCTPDCVEAMKAHLTQIPDNLIDYLLQVMPAARERCSSCGKLTVFTAGVADDEFYCSDNCHGRATALLIKPQPATPNIDGFDI